MDWNAVIGQENIKLTLQQSIAEKRLSHAQLFVGRSGYGVLPIVLSFVKEIFKQEKAGSGSKVDHLNHLDLHFSFPIFTENNKSVSNRLFSEFRQMILDNPYAEFNDWKDILDSQNKQLFISAEEIEEQNAKFSLKSFEGGTKILIVWQADKMNNAAANKFLKFLEEPPKNTLIFLIAENIDDILPTILSRCQLIDIPRISDDALKSALKENGVSSEKAEEIIFSAEGNWNQARNLVKADHSVSEFEMLFVAWVRFAFQAKKNPLMLKELVKWGRNIAVWNKEKQKQFLDYCAEMFRLALMQNYGVEQLVYKKIEQNFKWEGFSKFIHGNNIESIIEEISAADYHLSRNANSKIVWTDLGIKLTRFIHRTA
ncbi:DNA polymerase III subunit [Halpernia frigidisoli]|uniref:DNA polymerase-3 subunit delta n=1 Tax=Halpernia frigidisoli TaxID=1125876 RepID=A0A1I3CSG2_9FLAO|nr:DNA polymerase III subunit delta' [Halpernia frigidisoli]SFH77363.1 DNA polymerase-3 subunit delta' [Halpernia frigidisoli]